MGGVLLAVLALALAVFALTRKRLLWGVIGVGAHSLALAGLYLILAAPDVALTQAAIGFALVTFIYLLAVRHTGKLVVAACECPPLLHQQGERVVGLEWEILERFARYLHRELEVIWVPQEEISRLLEVGEADLAAGGYSLPAGAKVLLTRPLPLLWRGREPPDYQGDKAAELVSTFKEKPICFAVSPRETEVHEALEAFIEELERTGEMQKLVERYLA